MTEYSTKPHRHLHLHTYTHISNKTNQTLFKSNPNERSKPQKIENCQTHKHNNNNRRKWCRKILINQQRWTIQAQQNLHTHTMFVTLSYLDIIMANNKQLVHWQFEEFFFRTWKNNNKKTHSKKVHSNYPKVATMTWQRRCSWWRSSFLLILEHYIRIRKRPQQRRIMLELFWGNITFLLKKSNAFWRKRKLIQWNAMEFHFVITRMNWNW